MPYEKTSELPEAVQKKFQGPKLQQYLSVWNEVYRRTYKELVEEGSEQEEAKKKAETKAFSTAWGVAAKSMGEEMEMEPATDEMDLEVEEGDVVDYHGIKIVIENPVGSLRTWDDEQTLPHEPWRMANFSYGYIKDTISNEVGEELDCYLGPWENDSVYLVMCHTEDGALDEMKVMIGFADLKDVEKVMDYIYKPLNRTPPEIVEMSIEDFLESLSYQPGWKVGGSSNTAQVTEQNPQPRERCEAECAEAPEPMMKKSLLDLRAEAAVLNSAPEPRTLKVELKGPVYSLESFQQQVEAVLVEDDEREVAEVPAPLQKAVPEPQPSPLPGMLRPMVLPQPSRFELHETVQVDNSSEAMVKMLEIMQKRLDDLQNRPAPVQKRYVRRIERDNRGLVTRIVEEPEE